MPSSGGLQGLAGTLDSFAHRWLARASRALLLRVTALSTSDVGAESGQDYMVSGWRSWPEANSEQVDDDGAVVCHIVAASPAKVK